MPTPTAPTLLSRLSAFVQRNFVALLAMLLIAYVLIVVRYVWGLPLVMDEFAGAAQLRQFTEGLPYKDFKPYKTVLGYYLQLVPYLFGEGLWPTLMTVKAAMAIACAGVFGWASLELRRTHSAGAVLLALTTSLSMSTFLERSADLRVDALTALFGLASLLLLLRERVLWAGILAGVSFLVSQKGVYYLLAGGLALTTHWLLVTRTRERLRDVIVFGLASGAVVLLYWVVWGTISSYDAVFNKVVVAHQGIALGDQYPEIRRFWWQTLGRNPFFYAATVAVLLILLWRWLRGERDARTTLTCAYGWIVGVLCVWHKQPWPYFFVMLVPTAFVLLAAGFDWLLVKNRTALSLGAVMAFVVGVLHSLSRVPVVLAQDNSYQRETAEVAESLLGPEDTYFDGVQMIHTRRHFGHMQSLGRASLARLNSSGGQELAVKLRKDPPRLIVWNYRINDLPPALQQVIVEDYAKLGGNLMLYSPHVRPASSELHLRYSGRYQLLFQNPSSTLELDGQVLRHGQTKHLNAGHHRVKLQQTGRLVWVPSSARYHRYRKARPHGLFERVYEF